MDLIVLVRRSEFQRRGELTSVGGHDYRCALSAEQAVLAE